MVDAWPISAPLFSEALIRSSRPSAPPPARSRRASQRPEGSNLLALLGDASPVVGSPVLVSDQGASVVTVERAAVSLLATSVLALITMLVVGVMELWPVEVAAAVPLRAPALVVSTSKAVAAHDPSADSQSTSCDSARTEAMTAEGGLCATRPAPIFAGFDLLAR